MNNYQFDIMERCDFMPLTVELASLPFCCGETEGDKDLEDFFHHNALLYAQERLGKTYCFVNNEGDFSEIVAFFTVSNDSVKTTFIPKPSANKVQRTIPGQKHLRTYPAVLLGRLGVNKKYQGRNFLVGQQVMNFIKLGLFRRTTRLDADSWLLMRIISQKFLAFMSATSSSIYMPQRN